MKRIWMFSLAAVATVTLAAAPILAKAPVRHAASAALPAGQTCDPRHCSGACPGQAGADAAVSSSAAAVGQAETCPVSDPTRCPAGCPRHASSAVAARVTTR
jgi:hypothetical protein